MRDNLKEERLLILHMIHEGKVTPEEGNKLLESIKVSSTEEYQGIDMEEKINKFSSSVDSFAKDVGNKIGTAFKDAEPKIKKATKIALEKTALVIDDLSKALNDSVKNMEEKSEKDINSDGEDKDSTTDSNDDNSNLI